MTDYCNSLCQRHRPAATTNQYTPGHLQTHTNTSKQACTTRVSSGTYTRGHRHNWTMRRKHKHNCRDVYTLGQDHRSHTTCTHQLVTYIYVRERAHAQHNGAGKCGAVAYELQPHTEHNNLFVSGLLGGRGRAKWFLQPPTSPTSLHTPCTFLASVTSSNSNYLVEKRREEEERRKESGGSNAMVERGERKRIKKWQKGNRWE